MATNISDSETSAPSSGRRPSSGLSTFETVKRFKDFRLVWIGNFFAQGAQWLQILTIGWLVLQLTDGNALLTGTAVGVRTLPLLYIGPWAGVLADRFDRRKLIMVTQTVMAAAAAMAASSSLPLTPPRRSAAASGAGRHVPGKPSGHFRLYLWQVAGSGLVSPLVRSVRWFGLMHACM